MSLLFSGTVRGQRCSGRPLLTGQWVGQTEEQVSLAVKPPMRPPWPCQAAEPNRRACSVPGPVCSGWGAPPHPAPKASVQTESGLCQESVLWLLTLAESCPFSVQGLSQDSAKRLRFVPGVVYVDGTCSRRHPGRSGRAH